MGKNLDEFRAGIRDWQQFLYGALYLALDKPRLSDDQKKEWISDTLPLKGLSNTEYEELALALEWAVKVSPEWPKYIRRMKNVADNAERILRDYRAEMRAKRNADRAASGEEYSPACRALLEQYPDWTRKQILQIEPKRRAKQELMPIVKDCKTCEGKYWVRSKRPNLNGCLVECPECKKAKGQLFIKHYKAVKEELYGKVAVA